MESTCTNPNECYDCECPPHAPCKDLETGLCEALKGEECPSKHIMCPVLLYGQCGGTDWKGSTQCPPGQQCMADVGTNGAYSFCQYESDCAPEWSQCTDDVECCNKKFQCTQVGKTYKECRPSCPIQRPCFHQDGECYKAKKSRCNVGAFCTHPSICSSTVSEATDDKFSYTVVTEEAPTSHNMIPQA